MVLTVFFSSRISPRASTVILRDRSPKATAGRHVGDVSHLRRQVRRHVVHAVGQVLPRAGHAGHVGLSTQSSLRYLPLEATRVTSAANEESWSTMVFTVFFSSRISPLASAVIFGSGHPFATAVVTVGDVSHLTRQVTRPSSSPSREILPRSGDAGTFAWPPSTPSVPTSRATRVTSAAKALSWSTMVFTVFFSSRISPLAFGGDLSAQVALCHRPS
jgi:hypothetical protein